MTALILPKLGHCKSADEAIRELERMNARQVGSGNFSRVYRVEVNQDVRMSPRFEDFRISPRAMLDPWQIIQPTRLEVARGVAIVKVCTKPDRGALLVAKAAMACAEIDPLAPVYHGIIEFGGGTFVAELEELRPLVRVPVRDAFGYDTDEFPEQVSVTGNRNKRAPLDSVVASSPFLSLLARYIDKGYCWDIHGHNVMKGARGPVITDPMYHHADC